MIAPPITQPSDAVNGSTAWCILILANRVGTDDSVTFCGTSAVIDPYGATVAATSVDREELIQGEISENIIRSVRSRMAVFEHRRPDSY